MCFICVCLTSGCIQLSGSIQSGSLKATFTKWTGTGTRPYRAQQYKTHTIRRKRDIEQYRKKNGWVVDWLLRWLIGWLIG